MAKYRTRSIVLPVELDDLVREIARRENLNVTRTLELLVRTGIEAYIRETHSRPHSPTGEGGGWRREKSGEGLNVRMLVELARKGEILAVEL